MQTRGGLQTLRALGIGGGLVWLARRLGLQEQGKEKGEASRGRALSALPHGASRLARERPVSRANTVPGSERSTRVRSSAPCGPRDSVPRH